MALALAELAVFSTVPPVISIVPSRLYIVPMDDSVEADVTFAVPDTVILPVELL